MIGQSSLSGRSNEDALQEAVRLTQAINLEVIQAESIGLSTKRPSTLLGKGVIDRFAADIEEDKEDVDLLIVNHQLSPIQQRNLEKALNTKVIDRTGLILEIFGERAQTHEGRLQVELASYEYQKSRLVRSWTHLERQRGGAGFMGGPGERQLEIDRRLIAERISKLKDDLKKVRQTRQLHRKSKKRSAFPIVALVGYTNAGKSTLFNTMTDAKVVAKDQLFATLDTTMRAVELPSNFSIILSDTVGFITDLPTHLIEAFKATLEEINEADIILHVRDIVHSESEAQYKDVNDILESLGVELFDNKANIIEVWNKADLLPENEYEYLANLAARQDNVVLISAEKRQNLEDLFAAIEKMAYKARQHVKITIPATDGAAIAWIHEHGKVLNHSQEEGMMTFEILFDPEDLKKFSRDYADDDTQIAEIS